jgi:hypothetical protein
MWFRSRVGWRNGKIVSLEFMGPKKPAGKL